MIFTSDAVYPGDSYGPPAIPAAIVFNLEQFYASVEKLRSIAAETDATLVFGHDAEQMKQLRGDAGQLPLSTAPAPPPARRWPAGRHRRPLPFRSQIRTSAWLSQPVSPGPRSPFSPGARRR